MQPSALILSIIVAMLGLKFLLIGYLLKYQQMVEMLSGYDPAKVKDKLGLANFTGANAFLLGVSCLFTALLLLLLPQLLHVLMGGFILCVVGIVLRIIVGSRKYTTA